MEIGINTDCECGDSFKEILLNIKAAGFKNIMLSEMSGDLDRCLSLAREMGFGIPYVHLGYQAPFKNMNDMWKKGRENSEFVKDFVRRLKILNNYNIKTAVIHSYCIADYKQDEKLPVKHGLETMRKILKIARKLDIKIAVENLKKYNTVFTKVLLDNISMPNLGFCYDVGHKNLHTPKDEILKEYGDRCFAIHLHDNVMDDDSGNSSGHDLHYLPFDGKIDFEKEIGAIAASNYDGVIMIEVHRCYPGNKLHEIYKNISIADYLKQAKSRAEKLAEIFSTKRANTFQKNS